MIKKLIAKNPIWIYFTLLSLERPSHNHTHIKQWRQNLLCVVVCEMWSPPLWLFTVLVHFYSQVILIESFNFNFSSQYVLLGLTSCNTTLCLKKVSIFKVFVTLSNLNRFSKFCTAEKRMKFATKPYDATHLTLGMLLHYFGKLKFQIFCRYLADMEENANKLHF